MFKVCLLSLYSRVHKGFEIEKRTSLNVLVVVMNSFLAPQQNKKKRILKHLN